MIAACDVGPPPAVAIPATRSGSSAAASAAPTSPATRIAASAAPSPPPSGPGAGQALEHAPAHVQQVRCARTQVLVVEGLVAAGRRADGVVPRARRGRPARDPGLRRLDERLVAQQQELGVEDVRRLGAGALGRGRAQVAQVGRDGLARRAGGPLLAGGPAGASGMGGAAAPGVDAGPAAWPGAAATPTQPRHPAGAAAHLPAASGAGPAAALARAAVLGDQGGDGRQRLGRLGAAGEDPHGVAAQGAERSRGP